MIVFKSIIHYSLLAVKNKWDNYFDNESCNNELLVIKSSLWFWVLHLFYVESVVCWVTLPPWNIQEIAQF